MSVRVRIAPSPTGNLHIGTARTAVFNWLFARRHQGQFILRIEDTDLERSRSEYTDNILTGLQWLGLNWDEGPFYQTQRLDLYKAAVQQLLDSGKAYRCYCTEAELEALRESQRARNEAPRYDNRHRDLTPEQEAAFQAEGREAVIRFRIDDDREIAWTDLVRDRVVWKGSDLGGDMVIARRSPAGTIGQPLYNLAVVVDDIDMTISHVIRGEDHIANTAKQILLYEALGAAVPEFAHTPLILNKEGRKLSKRDGVTSISDFQNLGYLPEAIANYMTLLGWSPVEGMDERFSLAEAATVFDFDRVNKAGAKFDWDKLNWLNSQVIKEKSASELVALLQPFWSKAGVDTAAYPAAWLEELATLLGPSLVTLTDIVGQSQLFFSQGIELQEDAIAQLGQAGSKAVLQQILEALPSEALTLEVAKGLIDQAVKAAGVKKGIGMRSLRAALMGSMQGPDLLTSWVLLHQAGQAQPRLQAAIAAAQG
ncbi:glutamate--tRNA ligase [Synechococcus elongatus]|uniref:Glutamate--tRNA ligase n=2 Tax=Synechococcus elongatus TaxID=32046 RepID=SYE_SYNE7|nr:glutamate--tRNA ligase [Synechococcus elongatus]Q5N1B8.1 RecName: Full=Glutamate--tRNA ligase; AltName: Full=Glutamyl-tRNA synthetase; Short=GluRS [Synechococcus elongatus PCC 6301]Q8L1E5.1 RecName: Full=Glutamate--tRNA ligase; AltName: Full=Glutamyl-tRNA synthetase; Short=GluRS [Synechococcus elongatus PCC 7942 = FACHB-805]MBD2688215.1 glutamate--tRNA ligase [Synechococcus elongatus FACHB-1061]ABB58423.1 glutamyl-tRNA synthetase / glutamate--tRNA(Gln) ligase [Synechococcus elongatus PCC 794